MFSCDGGAEQYLVFARKSLAVLHTCLASTMRFLMSSDRLHSNKQYHASSIRL